MNTNWQKAKEIFAAGLDIDPAKRDEFLDDACGADLDLRRDVESLLKADDSANSFLKEPAISEVADVIAPSVRFERGKLFGQYEIVDLIGSGGMGEVYLARDSRLNRQVALKFLSTAFSGDPSRLRRFEREALAVSALNHPNILTIYELKSEDGAQFIATEYVKGETLAARLRRGDLELREILDVAEQTAFALATAHKAGIVHRDIKPENIMLRDDGIVKVLDFGLAKLVSSDRSDEVGPTDLVGRPMTLVNTNASGVIGTAAYMSPEQASGRTDIDSRTDIWSLGIVIYEMLTGRPPFSGEGIGDVIEAIRTQEPKSLIELRPETPPELQGIVEKCLSKDREHRFATARKTLDAFRDVRVSESVSTSWNRSARSVDRVTGRVGMQTAETTVSAPAAVAVTWPRRYVLFAVALLAVVLGSASYWFVADTGTNAVDEKVSDEAHQAYLRGRFFWNKRTGDDMKRAIDEFESALKADPDYALAYVGLADCYTLLELYTGAPAVETLPKAKEYALKAIELDGSSSEAHTSLGYVYYTLWQWGDAEKHLKRAVELDPKNPTAHHRYYLLLRETRRMDRAAEIITRARELDPLSLVINLSHARSFLIRGDAETCIDLTQKLIQLYPNYAPGHTTLGSAFIHQKRFPEAVAEMEKATAIVRNGQTLSSLGFAKALASDIEGAEAAISEMRPLFERREILGREIGLVYVGLDRYDEAFDWLETDFRNRSTELPSIVSIPDLEPIRKDPRFADLVRRMGLPEN